MRVVAAIALAAAPALMPVDLPAATGAISIDPRIPLVEHQFRGEERLALAELDRQRAADPAATDAMGYAFLRGHLLERLGRRSEAMAAFAETLGASPEFAPWARLRLAEGQAALGHPEVAAGLAATLLARDPPTALLEPALERLLDGLERGGDCRLLRGLRTGSWPRAQARRVELANAACELRSGNPDAAATRLRTLLLGASDDVAAFGAAELWVERLEAPGEPELLRALGEALAGQRDFARAVPMLESALAGEARDGSERESATIYLLARAQFWQGEYGRAARAFEELQRTTHSTSWRADARHQQARCLELQGDRAGAAALFLEAWELEPRGDWAAPSLLARLRLDWLAGRRLEAQAQLSRLAADRTMRSALARGALFLVASEVVAGRSSADVHGWIEAADRADTTSDEEIAYWRGRVAELEGRVSDALAAYLAAQRERPHHPYAAGARERLSRPELRDEAAAEGARRARGASVGEMRDASILLGPALPLGLAARARGVAGLAARPELASWIHWRPVPVADWPVFRDRLERPEDRLVALGMLREGSRARGRHFPSSRRDLALTASDFLRRQDEIGISIEIAEAQFSTLPDRMPGDWVAPELRQLLFPLPYRNAILTQASLRRIDPWLLAAVLREESRFRADAVSPVGARGISQLTLPTARRLSKQVGGGLRGAELRGSDLDRPEVAIPLAAAYLAELSARFGGVEPAILAAYNAGEAQTELWRSSCSTLEPEEFLAKIGFRETRAYVLRVLESRARYASLYGL
jgi:soluble lytic murein transglycosylase